MDHLQARLPTVQTVLAANAEMEPDYAGTMTLLAEVERALNSFAAELKACANGTTGAS
jgi:hypothetical protein